MADAFYSDGMRSQQWLLLAVVVLALLAGVAIAGFPSKSTKLDIRPLVTQPSTTTLVPAPSLPAAPTTNSGSSGGESTGTSSSS